MTVFKITRKKVTFGGAPQPAEEYKRNLRKKMKKRNQISEIFNIVVFFWFDKRFPGAKSSNL